MELKHLIVSYRYLKFFVEAFEQSNEALQKKILIIGLILIPNKKWTAFAVYFPQYFVVVLARRQPCGVLRLV